MRWCKLRVLPFGKVVTGGKVFLCSWKPIAAWPILGLQLEMPNSYPKFEPNLHHFNALPPPCFYKQTLSQLDTSQKNAGKLGKLTKMP